MSKKRYDLHSRNCDYCGKHYIGRGQYFCSNKCRRNSEIKDIHTEFLERVNIPDLFSCWEWISSKTRKGYGIFWYHNIRKTAHRISYELYKGEIPKGLCVCHKCNNSSCVNPAHLYAGTNQDNMNDKVKASRQSHSFGERSGTAKLTEKQVLEIFELIKNNVSFKDIAKKYNIKPTSVSNFNIGIGWKHLSRPIPIKRYKPKIYKYEIKNY